MTTSKMMTPEQPQAETQTTMSPTRVPRAAPPAMRLPVPPMKMPMQTPKPKVHTEFKARCQELTDVNTQLRDALREHHEREKSQDGVLGGLEESVNAKLNALALDAKTHREAAEKHKGELEASRARAADARKSLGQRGAELDAAKAEGARVGEAHAAV